ncbi:MAG TPA: Rrf2 family transcriptional regulator, partial [Flavobacteriaceae bacterium]|nr:Rrf2 family transcriptional regulator [Flavobacteriaceae bacterium]
LPIFDTKSLLMFSKACEYGIRSVVFIAAQSLNDKRPNIVEIARAINSPEPFTAKICQQLARSGIILSRKGPNGGFFIEKDSNLTLMDVVNAIDGNKVFFGCVLGLPECSAEHPCSVHEQYQYIRTDMRMMCENTKIIDLAVNYKGGDSFLRL